jgi:hypothetical protein
MDDAISFHIVRDGQTSVHKPPLVVSHRTRPPLFPSPLANSFIIGSAVINNIIRRRRRRRKRRRRRRRRRRRKRSV